MSWLSTLMTQNLTYWPPAAADINGNQTFSTPVSLLGRKEQKNELYTDRNGDDIMKDMFMKELQHHLIQQLFQEPKK